ncbi:unnamed protein product [Sympodiomycopsis kandeliae]
MRLEISHRNTKSSLDLPAESSLLDLRQRIFELTSVPPANQKVLPKPAKGIKLTDDTQSLEQAGLKDGISLMVLGATAAEVGQIQHQEQEESRWKQPRNYHPSMLKGTKPRTTGSASMNSLSATTSPFQNLAAHASLPTSDALHPKVIQYLSRLANDPGIIHVCHLHNYRIGTLTELLPWENPELLGLNENKGQTIRLRIRTDDAQGFRHYQTTRAVLIHELAHIDVSDHPPEFKILNSKLNAELAAYEKNVKEGTHSLHQGDMYVPAAEEESHTSQHQHVLGGSGLSSGPTSSEQRRQEVLQATLKRLSKLEEEIEVGCGSGQSPSQSTR